MQWGAKGCKRGAILPGGAPCLPLAAARQRQSERERDRPPGSLKPPVTAENGLPHVGHDLTRGAMGCKRVQLGCNPAWGHLLLLPWPPRGRLSLCLSLSLSLSARRPPLVLQWCVHRPRGAPACPSHLTEVNTICINLGGVSQRHNGMSARPPQAPVAAGSHRRPTAIRNLVQCDLTSGGLPRGAAGHASDTVGLRPVMGAPRGGRAATR